MQGSCEAGWVRAKFRIKRFINDGSAQNNIAIVKNYGLSGSDRELLLVKHDGNSVSVTGGDGCRSRAVVVADTGLNNLAGLQPVN